jgi:peptidylprolyl isomerase
MTQAKQGDTVKVHYTGKLDDGTVFDSSVERGPLEFTLGAGNVIAGFEQAVTGMSQGESKTVTIPSEEAYGPHRPEMEVQVGREQFPPDLKPQVGQQLQVKQGDGEVLIVLVTELTGDKVTLDANHPLAGKDLTFEIELLEVA